MDCRQHFPATKRLIEEAARQGDCQLLQDSFDVQPDCDPADPDLLKYIDADLRSTDRY